MLQAERAKEAQQTQDGHIKMLQTKLDERERTLSSAQQSKHSEMAEVRNDEHRSSATPGEHWLRICFCRRSRRLQAGDCHIVPMLSVAVHRDTPSLNLHGWGTI